MQLKIVRVGIVGVGNIGTAHATGIHKNQIQGMQLAALCDISADRRAFCRKEFPEVPVFEDFMEMFRSGLIDAAIVSTPHRFHCAIAAEALKLNLHVLTEKPADVSVSQAEKINALADTTDRVFGIMFNQRTNPLFQKAREIVQSGQLGNLKRSVWIITNWYRTQAYYDSGDWRATWTGEGGGVLLNQAPHNLDLWQWICGMPCALHAFCDVAKYHSIEVEDDVTIFARYPGGAVGTFITTTGEYPGTNRLEIAGDLGKIVLENNELKWWRLKENERTVCRESEDSSPVIPAEYRQFTGPESPRDGHLLILQNFTDAILEGTPLLAPGTDGIRELSISNAAYLSAWTGSKEVSIPFDSREFDALLQQKQQHSRISSTGEKETGMADYSRRWSVQW